MRINQAGYDKLPAEIYLLLCRITRRDGGNPIVGNDHIRFQNLAGEDVEHAPMTQNEGCGSITPRHSQYLQE
ncbi:MAG: hypothetical protein BWY63_03624 [Chloroflexi bacterium ADurb.Bin360]|nr:MAG: hypothetical protein BWY63_03624 [Chloroflexi bacterium ADurb.Bin360]